MGPDVVLRQFGPRTPIHNTWEAAAGDLLENMFPADTDGFDLAQAVQLAGMNLDVSTRPWTEDEVLTALEATGGRQN